MEMSERLLATKPPVSTMDGNDDNPKLIMKNLTDAAKSAGDAFLGLLELLPTPIGVNSAVYESLEAIRRVPLQYRNYTDIEHVHEVTVKKDRKRTKKDKDKTVETEDQTAALLETKMKASKRFMLPLTQRQINPCKIEAVRYIFALYCMQYGNSQPEMPESLANLDYIKMFGTTKELTELLDDEAECLQDTGAIEGWCMLNIVRNYMDAVFSYAHDKDILDSYLLSIAPCVSFKYWKDVTLLYSAQIDRMMAKGQQTKLYEEKMYGGPIYRKVGTLLSLHDVHGAVKVLVEEQLFKEAYILCRTRYVEELAKETLQQWAYFCDYNGIYNLSAICYIALGDVFKAANVLSKSSDEQSLHMADTMAKMMGQTAFSQHCFEKSKSIEKAPQLESSDSSEMLEPLPSRAQLLLNGQDSNGEENVNVNGANDINGEENVTKIATEINAVVESQENGKTSTTEEEGANTDKTVDAVSEVKDSEINIDTNADTIKPENDKNGKEVSEKQIEKILEDLPSQIEGMTVEPKDQLKNQSVPINGSGDVKINDTQGVVK